MRPVASPRRLSHPNTERAPRARAAPFRLRLVVMAKVPVAGRVKTRLAHDIGIAVATRFVRAATARLLRRVAREAPWETTLAVAPDIGVRARVWPCGIARVPQGGGDLGARMQRVMERTAPGPVVIIGTDVPGIRPGHVRAAFRLLGRHDAVFGPARDGGYWLVGLKRRPHVPRLFASVRWSSPHALADTLRNARGLSVARLEVLCDVDTAADLVRCKSSAGRLLR